MGAKSRARKRYEAAFKARVALAALKDEKTLTELASKFGVHGNLISQWKRRLLANVARVFEEPEDDAGTIISRWSRSGTVRSGNCRWRWTGSKKSCPVRPLNDDSESLLAMGA